MRGSGATVSARRADRTRTPAHDPSSASSVAATGRESPRLYTIVRGDPDQIRRTTRSEIPDLEIAGSAGPSCESEDSRMPYGPSGSASPDGLPEYGATVRSNLSANPMAAPAGGRTVPPGEIGYSPVPRRSGAVRGWITRPKQTRADRSRGCLRGRNGRHFRCRP